MRVKKFFTELKKRKIYQVAIAYIVLSWLILQVVTVLVPIIEAPESVSKVVLILLIIGFPIALVLAWAQGLRHSDAKAVDNKSTGDKKSRTDHHLSNANPCIAVLPFQDLSMEGDQAYFGQGMAEEIIIALNRLGKLRVVSRTAVANLQDQKYTLAEIGELLNAQTLLEGSIRKDGNKLRISTNLINVADNSHLWSSRYDREMEDIFSIQDDISEQVAMAIRGALTPGEKGVIQKPKTKIEAYEYFLQGRQLFHQIAIDGAKEMFEKAINLDPNYAPALAGLADAYSWNYQWQKGDQADLKAADKYSKMALELAPDLSESHSARAYVLSLRKQYEEAAKEFEKAIEINPESFTAYYLFARASFAKGNIEKSVEFFEKASQVNLEDYSSLFLMAQSEDMIRAGSGRQSRQIGFERVKNQLKLNPHDQRAWSHGATYLLDMGRADEAISWANRAMELKPEDTMVMYNSACTYARHGDYDKALDILEDYSMVSGNREWIERDPDLVVLRDHPRFMKLMEKMR